MSYEGYVEYIDAEGEYWTADAWEESTCLSPLNNLPPIYCHGVDITNGYDETHPSTSRAEKEQVGWLDFKRYDRFGSVYYHSIPKWKPVGPHWKTVNKELT